MFRIGSCPAAALKSMNLTLSLLEQPKASLCYFTPTILVVKGEPLGGEGLTEPICHLSSLTLSLLEQPKEDTLLFYSV